MKLIFKQEIMLELYEESSTSNTNLIILYTKWYLDQAKREAKAPSLPPFAAALLNALSAQFKFIEKKYSTTTKKWIKTEMDKLKYFLENLNRLRARITYN